MTLNELPEEPTVETAVSPPPTSTTPPPVQVIEVHSKENGRTPFWVLIAMSLGFLLPVFACGFLTLISFVSLGVATAGVASSGPTTTSTGFGDAVAIVRVEGTIIDSDSTEYSSDATSGVIIDDLKAAANDELVKAIVLRVNSPGGTVTGSAQIYETIKELDKPVIVSMAGTAASGGYYISAPADYIFARPDTTTGSLGVVLTLFNAVELGEKIGVSVESITSGPNKAIGSPWEELTEEQRDILDEYIDESYEEFVQIIADGRGMSKEEVYEIADGRIYSGRQALALDLVDELGDLDDAIAKAADLGGIVGEPNVIEYERIPSFSDILFGFSSQIGKTDAERVTEAFDALSAPTLEYRYVAPAQ